MRILVAGVGNIFSGDDAFGVEVIRRLQQREFPLEVTVRDFGIRSYDLAYALADGYDATILVDAVPLGAAPGTLQLIEVDQAALARQPVTSLDAHRLDPVAVLNLAGALGGSVSPVFVVGCQPGVLESNELGLSEPVEAAVPRAVETVEALVRDYLKTGQLPRKMP